jgi:hypothetical protein
MVMGYSNTNFIVNAEKGVYLLYDTSLLLHNRFNEHGCHSLIVLHYTTR